MKYGLLGNEGAPNAMRVKDTNGFLTWNDFDLTSTFAGNYLINEFN